MYIDIGLASLRIIGARFARETVVRIGAIEFTSTKIGFVGFGVR